MKQLLLHTLYARFLFSRHFVSTLIIVRNLQLYIFNNLTLYISLLILISLTTTGRRMLYEGKRLNVNQFNIFRTVTTCMSITFLTVRLKTVDLTWYQTGSKQLKRNFSKRCLLY